MKAISVLFCLWLVLPQVAAAFPLPKPGDRSPLSPPPLSGYDFEGIIRLSNCSGSFIRFENGRDTDKAMVLTNGHCLETGMPRPGVFVSHQKSTRRLGLMDANANIVGNVYASEVIYSTMTKTDMTLYKLTQSYAEIQTAYGVRPLTLASTHPDAGTAIQVISGYWSRGFSCSIESFAFHLQEDGWMMDDSLRYSRPGCEVIGGTSGSPVIASGTRNVIAINNTINEDGARCTRNNPCEVDANGGVVFQRGFGYAQETYLIYSCLNANNEFDLSVPGCQLLH